MFGARLAEAMAEHGPVCVGIDPHDHLLDLWGLPHTAAGVREFSLRTVAELAGTVAAVKPQSAFFEQYGAAGVAALEETLAAAREAGLITVLDVKRGDIGSTMGAYARAYLSPDSPLAADSITVSPYLGFGALAPALELAGTHDRGVFVLALTSNPEGREVQHAHGAAGTEGFGTSVAGSIVAKVAAHNAAEAAARGGGDELGRFGLVVGATIGTAASELGFDPASCAGPILAPTPGAQGAGVAELVAVFGAAALARNQVLATTSRGVLGAGPDGVREAATFLNEALRDLG
ncbi:orotidine-5'-phosphate decarboxylase [Brevibacterium celere]|uniref:Orotidine-5'-phosphate decarboxylase n=1 Tax=Brevibacterium celere TaxID=225845 RepID=A0A366IGZ8_9MICO|nr:orotidine-5'-phosphate decarboxylase [Brevibacterium celere]RBP70839.1 orotidine-5'-phosphate decarboxylase [Brevibacterium celere]